MARRRRRKPLLQFDSSTDLLSCGVGAALLLLAVFMATIGFSKNEEDQLYLISIIVDSAYTGQDVWGGASSCLTLELSEQPVATTCGEIQWDGRRSSPAKVRWQDVMTFETSAQVSWDRDAGRIELTVLADLPNEEAVSLLLSYNRSTTMAPGIPYPTGSYSDATAHRFQRRIPQYIFLSVQDLGDDTGASRVIGYAETLLPQRSASHVPRNLISTEARLLSLLASHPQLRSDQFFVDLLATITAAKAAAPGSSRGNELIGECDPKSIFDCYTLASNLGIVDPACTTAARNGLSEADVGRLCMSGNINPGSAGGNEADWYTLIPQDAYRLWLNPESPTLRARNLATGVDFEWAK